MRFLKSGRVPKANLDFIYRVAEDASVQGLREVRPIVQETIAKIVGTQYYSLASLRKMGYPYKSRSPGGLHPGIINVQSGKFFKAFRITGPVRAGRRVTIWVENDNPLGDLLERGTSRMIKRPWRSYLMWNLNRAISPILGPIIAKNIKIREKIHG
jgi:hypothetical protein